MTALGKEVGSGMWRYICTNGKSWSGESRRSDWPLMFGVNYVTTFIKLHLNMRVKVFDTSYLHKADWICIFLCIVAGELRFDPCVHLLLTITMYLPR